MTQEEAESIVCRAADSLKEKFGDVYVVVTVANGDPKQPWSIAWSWRGAPVTCAGVLQAAQTAILKSVIK